MDWKREAADKLRVYQARKDSLASIAEEIKRLTDEATSIRSATTDGTPVSGGSSTREDRLVNSIAKRQELQLTYKITRSLVKQVDTALAALDEEEQLVLDRFYIHRAKGNVQRLCDELCVEQSSAYRRRDSALRHFTIALYGMVEV